MFNIKVFFYDNILENSIDKRGGNNYLYFEVMFLFLIFYKDVSFILNDLFFVLVSYLNKILLVFFFL